MDMNSNNIKLKNVITALHAYGYNDKMLSYITPKGLIKLYLATLAIVDSDLLVEVISNMPNGEETLNEVLKGK